MSKLIGSPPGYVGYEEGGQLTERVKRSPYSVVLLDEIEKAHPDVFNILLQVFEDGQLTDGLGNTVDFKNTILIMTSNIGARHLQKKQGLGFQSDREDLVSDKIEELVKSEVKKTFNPEFLNRLDEVILFLSLSRCGPDPDRRTAGAAAERKPGAEGDHHLGDRRSQEVDPRQDPWRSQLRCASVAPRTAALRRRSAVGGADRWRITQRPAFLEVYLENNQLFYRPVSSDESATEEKAAGVLLFSN